MMGSSRQSSRYAWVSGTGAIEVSSQRWGSSLRFPTSKVPSLRGGGVMIKGGVSSIPIWDHFGTFIQIHVSEQSKGSDVQHVMSSFCKQRYCIFGYTYRHTHTYIYIIFLVTFVVRCIVLWVMDPYLILFQVMFYVHAFIYAFDVDGLDVWLFYM